MESLNIDDNIKQFENEYDNLSEQFKEYIRTRNIKEALCIKNQKYKEYRKEYYHSKLKHNETYIENRKKHQVNYYQRKKERLKKEKEEREQEELKMAREELRKEIQEELKADLK